MRIGIEASNIRIGGGVTHLVELLRAANPDAYGIQQITVWSGNATLRQFAPRPWLQLAHDPLLDRFLPSRLYWQITKLPKLVTQYCDVLFVPGGTYRGDFRPFVTMSQNMLPFEDTERRRYGFSWMRLKMILLRLGQGDSFHRANGLIFLTRYAQRTVQRKIGLLGCRQALIPHGISDRFRLPPRAQRSIKDYSFARPFRFLYVSTVDVYKHQSQVVEAIAQLRKEGFPVELELVGSAYPPSMRLLRRVITNLDPERIFIQYQDAVPYVDLPKYYHQADAFIFASSCENMPNILLEAMAAGLPIACSNRGPMPEVLGDAGVFFDPESPCSIANASRVLLQDLWRRNKHSIDGYQCATAFTWDRCASETLKFLAEVANSSS